ncbi:MAG: TonB family protein [Flavobacteriales bacterium]|jgi:TonB family protein
MKFSLTIIFIYLASVGFSQKTITQYFDADWKLTNKKKAVYYRKAIKMEDDSWKVIDYYKSGEIQMKGSYHSKDFEIKEGKFRYYYESGVKRMEYNYLNNIAIGRYKFWYQSSQLKVQGEYNEAGNKTGVWKNWDTYGNSAFSGEYVNGNMNGEWLYYFPNGEIQSKENYEHGSKIGHWEEWHENGKLNGGGYYKSDLKTGEWIWYYDNGQLITTYNYNEQGKEIGEHISWHKGGEKKCEGKFKNGNKEGEWKWYFENNQMSSKEQFSKDSVLNFQFFTEKGEEITEGLSYETEPEYPGGTDSLYIFLGDKMKYPAAAMDKNIEGKVYVSFIVENDGEVLEAKVIGSAHPLLDKEALRVINIMPNWTPGIQHNQIVRVIYNIPINFQIN